MPMRRLLVVAVLVGSLGLTHDVGAQEAHAGPCPPWAASAHGPFCWVRCRQSDGTTPYVKIGRVTSAGGFVPLANCPKGQIVRSPG